MLFFIQNMSRSLVVDNNPQVVTENASIEDIDIDHVAFNVALNHKLQIPSIPLQETQYSCQQIRAGAGAVKHGIFW